MKSFLMVVTLVLVVSLGGLASAQPAPTPAATPAAMVSANQPLADAVKQAEAAKDINAALAASMKLEASSLRDGVWVDNTRKIAVLLWKSGKADDALAWLKSAVDTVGLDDAVRGPRAAAIYGACMELIVASKAGGLKVEFAHLGLTLRTGSGTFNVFYLALLEAGKPDDALQACLDYADKAAPVESMRARRMTLLAALKRNDALRAEAMEYLKVSTDPMASAKALAILLPADDVSLCCGLTAQQVLDGYKAMLRAKDGRVNVQVLLKLTDQLTKGGDARPLVVTDQAKTLADKLTNAPLAAFLVPLLKGDYPPAVKEGYARAKASAADAEYVNWVNATAGAIRCMDQHYNGRALDFIKFINGAADVNPIASMVGP